MAINKRKILQSAQKNLQKGALDKALKEYKSLLEADPKDQNLRLKIGDIHLRMGNTDEAVTAYAKVAERFMKDGFDAKAVALYKQITKIDGKRIDVYVPLSELYQRLGLLSDAMNALQTAADAHYREGNKPAALDLLRKMATLDPTNTTNRLKVAELLRQEGMSDEALSEFEAVAIELDRQGEVEGRISVLRKILDLDPQRGTALDALARAYLNQRKWSQAEELGRKLVAEVSEHCVEGWEIVAEVCQAVGRGNELPGVYKHLAHALRERGDEDRAREVMQRFGTGELAVDQTDASMISAPEDRAALDAAFGGSGSFGGDEIDDPGFISSDDVRLDAPEVSRDVMDGRRVSTASASNADMPLPPLPEVEESEAEVPGPDDEGGPAPEGDPEQLVAEAGVYLRYGKVERAIESLRAALAQEPAHLPALRKMGEALVASEDPENAVRAFVRAGEAARAAGDTDALAGVHAALLELDAGAAAPFAPGGAEPASEAPAPPGDLSESIEIEVDDLLEDETLGDAPATAAREAGASDGAFLDDTSEEEILAGGDETGHDIVPDGDGDGDDDGEGGIEFELDVSAAAASPAPAAEAEPDFEDVSDGELEFVVDDTTSQPVLSLDEEAMAEAPADAEAEASAEESSGAGFALEGTGLDDVVIDPTDASVGVDVTADDVADDDASEGPDLGARAEEQDTSDAEDAGDADEESSGSSTTPQRIVEDLEEGEFYLEQGMLDEAEEVYRRILVAAPNHPQAMLRLGEIEAQRAAAAPEPAPDPAPTMEAAAPAPAEADDDDATDPARVAEPEVPAAAAPVPARAPAEAVATVDARPSGGDLHDDDGFDLAAELSDALDDDAGAPGSASTEEEGFEQVFAAFKAGVEKELGQGDHEARYDLGIAYKEMGLLDDAIGEFRVAMQDPPRRLQSLHMMSLCALDLGRAEDAVAHLEQALAEPGVDTEQQVALRFDLGRAYERQGDVGRARSTWEAVIAEDPDFCDVQERLEALAAAPAAPVPAPEEPEAFENFDDLIGVGDAEEAEPAEAAPEYESFDDLMGDEVSETAAPVDDETQATEIRAEEVEEPAPEAPDPEPDPEPAGPDPRAMGRGKGRGGRRKKISFV